MVYDQATLEKLYRGPSKDIPWDLGKPYRQLIEFVKKNEPCLALDVGCGTGTDAIFLAQRGLEVYAADYIGHALDILGERAKKAGVTSKISLSNLDLGKKWPFKDNFFDLAIDCYSSIDIETKNGRETCRDEMFRTLKPKGLALVTCISTNDSFEKELLRKSPGKEKNTVYWPGGKFEKLYDKNELRSFFSPPFKTLKLEVIHKKSVLFGREYDREGFWMVLKKV